MYCQITLRRDPTNVCNADYATSCVECTAVICERHTFPSVDAVRPLCPSCAPWHERLSRIEFFPETVRFAGLSEPVIAAVILAAGALLGALGAVAVLS